MVRALDAVEIRTASDILFVATVGEEGPGDLRGVKHLFTKGVYKDKIKTFISLDILSTEGNDDNKINNGALGSKRYRVTFKGPGGHSYQAFGLVNPAFAMGNAIQKFSEIKVPTDPKTTFNVGVVGGGTSVNSIPYEMWMDVDMRSVSPEKLNALMEEFKATMHRAAEEENARRVLVEGAQRLEPILRVGADHELGPQAGKRPPQVQPQHRFVLGNDGFYCAHQAPIPADIQHRHRRAKRIVVLRLPVPTSPLSLWHRQDRDAAF